MGRELGVYVGDQIKAFNDRYFSDDFNVVRFGSPTHLQQYVHEIEDVLREYSPKTHDFLSGLAEGSRLAMEHILMQAILPELTHISAECDWPSPVGGCTACCISADAAAGHGTLLGQCWDFNIQLPPWYLARLSPPLDGPQMLIVGMGAFCCPCGINTHGLGVTFTSSGHLPNISPKFGVPIVALFLEALSCEGYFEAMDTLVAPRHAGAMNVLLSDDYTRSALIEISPEKVELIEQEPVLVCANHYQHPTMVEWQDLNPPEGPAAEFARSSVFRAERMRKLLKNRQGKIDAEYIKVCLKDHENHPLSICAHEEQTILHFRTLGAMVLEPAMRTIQFCQTNPCSGSFRSFNL